MTRVTRRNRRQPNNQINKTPQVAKPIIDVVSNHDFEEEKFYDSTANTVESVELFKTENNVVVEEQFNTTNVEKVKPMSQTYVEDTFDINNIDSHEEVVIDNPVTVKEKMFISEEELLKSFKFGVKLTRYKTHIEYFKTFKELYDLSTFSKMNRGFFINDTTDEVDILIREIVLHFRRRLSQISVSYEDYQKINTFFDSLQSIYNRFKHSESAAKDDLKLELKKLIEVDKFIASKIFVKGKWR